MTELSIETLRMLGRFWLEEIRPADINALASLPDLAADLPETDPDSLTELAVEYQRLFGFNLPPYESVFVDPSAMLMAPATDRVQALYGELNWQPPAGLRAGAPDHLGVELLALAAGLERGQLEPARRIQTQHLAVWAPVFLMTLTHLSPHPFYAALGQVTLDHLLATLPAEALPPELGPDDPDHVIPLSDREDEASIELREIVDRLLTPYESGLFLTRDDIGRISRTLNLPPAMGERKRMLDTLFRLAGEYDLVTDLFSQLEQILAQIDATYETWAGQYPPWRPYARLWQQRLAASQALLQELSAILLDQNHVN